MKILRRSINAKDGEGVVRLRCEDEEDLWHAYNLVEAGDRVRCSTFRKVTKSSSTGSVTSNKMRLTLTLTVTKTDFDAEGGVLRVTGRNSEPNPHVQMGAHHTLDIEVNREFTIEKSRWDAVALDRIEMASNPDKTSEVAILVMQPGLAHLCLLKGQMTILKSRIEVSIPRKRAGVSAVAKGEEKFFRACYDAITRHVDFSVIKVLLVASPGFVASDFVEYAMNYAGRHEDRNMLDSRQKMLVTRAASGHKNAIEEVLGNPAVLSQLADVHAAEETRVLSQFFETLRMDTSRAFYGYRHIEMANENFAIDKLLISDSLFRSRNPQERRKYVDLVESVRENRGEVHLFSSMHVSGAQLNKITGIAAILRFPLPDLEDIEVEDDSDDDKEDVDEYKEEMLMSPELDGDTRNRRIDEAEQAQEDESAALADQMKEDLGF